MFSPQQDPKQIFDRIFGSTSALLKGGLNKGADAAEGLYNNFHDAAEQTGVPQAVGGALGAAGGAIGGAVGGLGNFFTQSLQGKGLDPKLMGQDIANTARSTANFGYNTGKEGAIAAPMANAGKLVSGAMALPPARGVMQDVQSGNVNLGTGLKAGAAAASLYGAAKSPNWTPGGVFDPQLKALAGKIKDNVGIPGAGTMQESGGYNGYKNWDTWNKNLWLNNDEPQYRQMQSILKNAKSLEEGAQMLKRSFSNAFDDGIDKSKVDWMEIAKVNMEDMVPQSPVMSNKSRGQIVNSMDDQITTRTLQKNLNSSYDKLMAPGNPEGEAIKMINGRQIVNSMDDGLDTSSNYGENLMNNDGGASPSVMKNHFGGYQQGGINAPDLSKTAKAPNPFPGEFGQQQDIRAGLPSAQPGKWTDAYSRPMKTGMQWGDAGTATADSITPEAQAGLNRGDYGALSVPNLTPAQTGAVSKVIKQSQALKGKMGVAGSAAGLSVPKNAAKAYSSYFGSKFSDSEIAQLFKDDPQGFIEGAKMGGAPKEALSVLEQMTKKGK